MSSLTYSDGRYMICENGMQRFGIEPELKYFPGTANRNAPTLELSSANLIPAGRSPLGVGIVAENIAQHSTYAVPTRGESAESGRIG